jgi:hypothetical protein
MNTVSRQVTNLTVRAVVEMIRRDPEKNMSRLRPGHTGWASRSVWRADLAGYPARRQ